MMLMVTTESYCPPGCSLMLMKIDCDGVQHCPRDRLCMCMCVCVHRSAYVYKYVYVNMYMKFPSKTLRKNNKSTDIIMWMESENKMVKFSRQSQ